MSNLLDIERALAKVIDAAWWRGTFYANKKEAHKYLAMQNDATSALLALIAEVVEERDKAVLAYNTLVRSEYGCPICEEYHDGECEQEDKKHG